MFTQTLGFGICNAKSAKHNRNPAATIDAMARLRLACLHAPLTFGCGRPDCARLNLLAVFAGGSRSMRCGSAMLHSLLYIIKRLVGIGNIGRISA